MAMTKSYNKKILRGIKIEGTTFCSPSGSVEDSQEVSAQNKDNLKALEDFWYQKGITDGEKSGHEKGFIDGLEKGTAQGNAEGKKEGLIEGKDQGIQEGILQTKNDAQAEIEHPLHLLERMIESMSLEKENLFQKLKPELIKFSLAVCEKILDKELQNPDSLKNLFKQLMSRASPIIQSEPINIHLPKETFSRNQSLLQEAASESGLKNHTLLFEADSSLSEGSLRIETGLGLINFDIPRLMREFEASALTDYVTDDL